MAARAGFGRRLELAIVQAGTTKGALAKRLGKSPQQVSNWLRRDDPPSPGIVSDLARTLGVQPGWLAFGEGEEERAEDALHDPSEGADETPGIGEDEIRMPQVIRFLKLHDGKPDERELKLATVRIWGEVLALNGAWPDWFLVLRGKVERGEI